MRGIALLLALGIVAPMLSSVARAADCGCEKPACNTCNAKVTIQVCERPSCCRTPRCLHHHHCKSCCEQPPQQTPRGNAAPPAGPIYESMPMARSMPMMAMPVMMASYQVAPHAATFEEPRRESTCASSTSEIELLKQRFDRLHERVNTLQTSMDRQTQILEKITENLEKLNAKK